MEQCVGKGLVDSEVLTVQTWAVISKRVTTDRNSKRKDKSFQTKHNNFRILLG